MINSSLLALRMRRNPHPATGVMLEIFGIVHHLMTKSHYEDKKTALRSFIYLFFSEINVLATKAAGIEALFALDPESE